MVKDRDETVTETLEAVARLAHVTGLGIGGRSFRGDTAKAEAKHLLEFADRLLQLSRTEAPVACINEYVERISSIPAIDGGVDLSHWDMENESDRKP